jgi:hypothetical protein
MESLPSDFPRHSFSVLHDACVTRVVVTFNLQNSVFFLRYPLYPIIAQYILGVRFYRIPSKNVSGRLNPQGRIFHSCVFHLRNLEKNL